MNREGILGVSWLHERMQFVACSRKGATLASWECAAKAEELGTGAMNLSAILKEAVAKTRYRGKEVALVLDHEKLTQQLIETPPTKGKDLELYVERKVDELKVVDEAVVSSWQETQPIKMSKGLVLYLFPEFLRKRLCEDCREAGLHLVILASPTAVLRGQLSHLPLKDEEIALLAAETGNTTAIVIGSKEGPIYLGRSLRCNWQAGPERVTAQIDRSMVFLKQQFGKDLDSVWLAGTGAENQVEIMTPAGGVPVNLSPVECTALYWAEQVANLPPEDDSNLISSEMRHAPKRKVFARVTGLLLGMQVLLSVGVSALIETQVRHQVQSVEDEQPRAAEIQERKNILGEHFTDLEKMRSLSKLIGEESPDPIPYWFLNYVADIIPDELLLTELQVQSKSDLPGVSDDAGEDEWAVRVQGAGRVMSQASASDVQAAFSKLAEELANGPFHIRITDKTKRFTPGEGFTGPGGPKWTVNGSRPGEETDSPFFIEGVMRGKTSQ